MIEKKNKRNGRMRLSTILNAFTENVSIARAQLVDKLLDPRRDINAECGYPDDIKQSEYRILYDREGVGRRVVEFWPEESWVMDPEVTEDEEAEDTEFETAWKNLQKEQNVYFHLHRIDELSGIGRFGVLLLGFDDGKEFKEPVDGLPLDDQNRTITGISKRETKLIYIRAFDENVATVDERENDPKSPRFGQPTMYTLEFEESEAAGATGGLGITGGKPTLTDMKIHWTRVIHVADNRETSEIFGTPRMQVVFNRLLDIRKVLSGSGEMFWKGAFPGYALETDPSIPDADIDEKSIRKTLSDHFNGLQRYFTLVGMKVKSLAPQVEDPSGHVDVLMDNIAFTLGVPKRKFMGSEQAQLASAQDSRTFNNRVARRQNKYLTPLLLRPFVDRMIVVKVLPEPKDGYEVKWPDLNTVTDEEKAKVAKERTDALAKYVMAGVEQLIPPDIYLKLVQGYDQEQVDTIIKAMEEFQDDIDESETTGSDGPDPSEGGQVQSEDDDQGGASRSN